MMIRGRNCISIAVRTPTGSIKASFLPIYSIFYSRLRSWLFVRGVIVLFETLLIGMRALNRSAVEAMGEEEVDTNKWVLAATMLFSGVVGMLVFLGIPLLAVGFLHDWISSDLLSNLIEGIIRLIILILYIVIIAQFNDMKRVFGYHGAEHMAVHAHEHDMPLTIEEVSKYDTAHPRCGTAFLLTVSVVAVVAFAFLERTSLWLSVVSRVALLPVIAAISYEIVRFSGTHSQSIVAKLSSVPGLALQSLTTRRPDNSQIEVAIVAMKRALDRDSKISNSQSDSAFDPDDLVVDSIDDLIAN